MSSMSRAPTRSYSETGFEISSSVARALWASTTTVQASMDVGSVEGGFPERAAEAVGVAGAGDADDGAALGTRTAAQAATTSATQARRRIADRGGRGAARWTSGMDHRLYPSAGPPANPR